ncbi:MAG TPA: 6,7-dimethyl-8-ribityllumazine synthase, partial [Deltaproteobacteria bacterium]|nr:6,7-dimethyl-8-ribityllumazine synthase [Deltaproteobacteria bacterium]
MANIIEGGFSAKGLKFAIVMARFNEFIGERLLEGALDTLRKCGADEKDVDVVRVPGSFEIPLVVKALAERKRYDAIVCVGAIIRGDTPHFDYVAGEAAKGIARA